MNLKHLFALAAVCLLAAVPVFAQFPSAAGNETTGSYGQFQILVEPKFASLFTSCPGWDPGTRILTSPVLYDPGTVIGVSAATTAPHPSPIPVGTPAVSVGHPGGFPMPAPGTRLVRTQIRSLNMTGSGVTVALGPGTSSPGEVDSHSTSGVPANDFPARSFFDVFVQLGLPHCGGLPAGTTNLYNRNNEPLRVEADGLTSLPPVVVYMHDTTSTVPIRFTTANGRLWKRDDILGCIVLAGHGVGVKENNPGQREQFEKHMKEHGRAAKACTAGPIIRPGIEREIPIQRPK